MIRRWATISMMFVVPALVGIPGALVFYPFSTDLNPTVTGSNVTPTLTVSNLSQAYIASDGFGNVMEAYPSVGSTSAALALTNNSYFTLSLNSQASLGNLAVNFLVGKGGASDPRGYFVRSSLDGFTTNLVSQTLPSGANQTPAPASFQLNASGRTAVTLRFYVWTPSPVGNSVDFSALQVAPAGGTTASAPAVSTWGLVLLAIMLGLAALLAQRKLIGGTSQPRN